MIRVKMGNLLKSDAHALINTVNTVGVMGKGIALAFKREYPEMFQDYVARCHRGEVRLGEPYPYFLPDGRIIINFPTKEHWRSVSSLDAIVHGLGVLRRNYKEWGVRSVAVPPLGCGNGQLEWRVVGPTLHRHLADLDIPVEIYAPHGTPQAELQLSFFEEPPPAPDPQWVQPGIVALVEAVSRITAQQFHWPVGRTRFQKIAYFLTAEGVPTGLAFERGSYGPYAADVNEVKRRLLNNGLVREVKRGRMYAVELGPTYEDGRRAYADDLVRWSSTIDRVVDLFARVDTDEAEVAATVHFVAFELSVGGEHLPTEFEVIEEVMRWKANRRPPLDRAAVASSVRNLAMLGWIRIEPSESWDETDDLLVG